MLSAHSSWSLFLFGLQALKKMSDMYILISPSIYTYTLFQTRLNTHPQMHRYFLHTNQFFCQWHLCHQKSSQWNISKFLSCDLEGICEVTSSLAFYPEWFPLIGNPLSQETDHVILDISIRNLFLTLRKCLSSYNFQPLRGIKEVCLTGDYIWETEWQKGVLKWG